MGIKHAFQSAVADGGDSNLVQPSNWNADHVLRGYGFGANRQTVLKGPVDSNGLPNFGGSTGSTTVTTSGDLVVSAAAGFDANGAADRVGLITNASWTGLSSNGTMYLYLDVDADGVCTTGSTTLAPIYQEGGSYSVTNGQFTFNFSEMIGKAGNGSAASQVYRVFVGEVTVAGGVVTAITWYALRGRYISAWTSTLAGTNTTVTANHNLGTVPLGYCAFEVKNTTTQGGYAVGEIVCPHVRPTSTALGVPLSNNRTRLSISHRTGTNQAYRVMQVSAGTEVDLTASSWDYRYVVNRGW
jgi:hypothetical protein